MVSVNIIEKVSNVVYRKIDTQQFNKNSLIFVFIKN
jgi:hypothetical protein